MARTYRKFVKCGICTGSNTEFYRDRNRKARQMNRHNLRNLMANHSIEEVDELIGTVILPHDDWNEPTDGTFIVGRKSRKSFVEDVNLVQYGNFNAKYHDGTPSNYWNRKFGKYLKSKKYKH